MKRLPLSDQLSYEFIPPRHSRFWFWAGTYYNRHRMTREQRIADIDVAGMDRLGSLVEARRFGTDHPEPCRPRRRLCSLRAEPAARASHSLTWRRTRSSLGMARWVLPRVGVFSVDREGADLSAFKAAVNLLAEGKHPLVIFPEGEIYRVAERLTPFREGAFAIAAAAARKLEGTGRKLWILPAGICYRFLEGHDPLPALRSLMDRLEARFTWRVQPTRAARRADSPLRRRHPQSQGSRVPRLAVRRKLQGTSRQPDRAHPRRHRAAPAQGAEAGDRPGTREGTAQGLPGDAREGASSPGVRPPRSRPATISRTSSWSSRSSAIRATT